jgi:PAS domain S-box-containing protein
MRSLLTSMPAAVVYVSGSDLAIRFASDASSWLVGDQDVLGKPLSEVVPELAAQTEIFDRIMKTGEPVRSSGERIRSRHDGRAGQLFVDYVCQPVRDADHGIAGILLHVTDVTAHVRDRQELQEAATQSADLLGRLRDANVLGVMVHGEQQVDEANDAFLDIIGYSRDDVAAGQISYQSITPPEWVEHSRSALEELRRSGAFQPFEKEYVHRDGHRVQVLVGGALISLEPLRWVAFVVDLSARQRAEQERAELLVRERAAKAEADGARERLTFLLRAGDMVAASRSRHEMLEHAAHLIVPVLGDHCVVWLADADGTLHATSLVHRDPARAPVLAEFGQHEIPPVGPMSIQIAYSTAATQVMRDAKAQLPRWGDLTPGLADILARLEAESVLSIPLLVDKRPVGVLSLTRDTDRPGFTAMDIEVVEEFARRLADGLATADAFAREHTIAETLQRSVLPDTLPSITGLDLAVCYLPATGGADVGGDWYDAFLVDGDRVGLVIGDVTGHNIGSASIMGQVRSMLRAYAIDHADPAKVMERTNMALGRLLPEALATAVYAVLDPATGELIYANAGHLPSLIATGFGEVHYLDDTTGTMLGASPDISFTAGRRRLCTGDVLLNYTDGLIENGHRDLIDGLGALAAVMRQPAARTARQACAQAQGGLLDTDSRDDDVCLLAVRLQD